MRTPVVLVLSVLSQGAGSARDGGTAPKKEDSVRTFSVRGKNVSLPGEWLECRESADCAWVTASCADVETGVNAKHRDEAKKRLEIPCAAGNFGMIRPFFNDVPECRRGLCARSRGFELDGILGSGEAAAGNEGQKAVSGAHDGGGATTDGAR